MFVENPQVFYTTKTTSCNLQNTACRDEFLTANAVGVEIQGFSDPANPTNVVLDKNARFVPSGGIIAGYVLLGLLLAASTCCCLLSFSAK